MGQIKERIMHGELKEDTAFPSVRTFAKELKVSALTVKKAYDGLEEGFIVTVHGKDRSCGMSDQEIRELFQMDKLGTKGILGVIVIIWVIVGVVSMIISMRVMEKREF